GSCSRRRPSRKRDSAPSRSCFFPWLIWTGWTWKTFASSATVRVRLAASRATLALKAAECRLRLGVLMHLGMGKRPSISITSRAVQLQGSTSVSKSAVTRESVSSCGRFHVWLYGPPSRRPRPRDHETDLAGLREFPPSGGRCGPASPTRPISGQPHDDDCFAP